MGKGEGTNPDVLRYVNGVTVVRPHHGSPLGKGKALAARTHARGPLSRALRLRAVTHLASPHCWRSSFSVCLHVFAQRLVSGFGLRGHHLGTFPIVVQRFVSPRSSKPRFRAANDATADHFHGFLVPSRARAPFNVPKGYPGPPRAF